MRDICTIEGCSRQSQRRSYCGMHYQRIMKYGRAGTAHPLHEHHGKRGLPEYCAWVSMKDRCFNSNKRDWENYGGRGITVCDPWSHSFDQFLRDMGPRPGPNYSIDRIDVDGNYEPGNCRWTTSNLQAINRRIKITNTTGFRGISYIDRLCKYQVEFAYLGRRWYLGVFAKKEEAAAAYNKKATEVLGGDARLNII